MTKRERCLLCIALAALALVVDLRILLLPALEERAELEEMLFTLTEQQDFQLRRIQTLDYIDEAIATHEEALSAASSPYYCYLTTEDMDRIVTDLLLRHGFFPQKLTLEEGRAGSTQGYLSDTKQKKTGTAYDGVPLSALLEDGAAEEIAAKGQQYLYTANVSFTAVGENWMALLDDVSAHYPGIRTASFELAENGTVEGTFVLSLYGP